MTPDEHVEPPGSGRRVRTPAAVADAASRLFATQGMADTSLELIAQHAGASAPLIREQFGTEDQLFLVLTEDAAAALEARLAVLPRASSPLQRLFDFGDGYVDFALTDYPRFQLIAARGCDPSTCPALKALHDRIDDRIQQLMRALVADARAAIQLGELGGLPPELAVAFLLGSWNGVIALHAAGGPLPLGSEAVREMLAGAGRVLVRGLGGSGIPHRAEDMPMPRAFPRLPSASNDGR